MMVPMKSWVAGGLLIAAVSTTVSAGESLQQQGPPPTVSAVREAVAAGRPADAWAMMNRLPIEMATVELAVELALAPRTPFVAAAQLPFLADRTARLSLDTTAIDNRLTACAIVVRTTNDAACAEQLSATTRGTAGNALDRARLWVTRRLLGEQPAALPIGWETEVQGSSALEVAAWSELPPASRVRLIEPLLSSQDPGVLIAALGTLQLIPGPDALAAWQRLAKEGGPTYPGARTQIAVGLARHGDPESLKALTPYLDQLSVSDRLVLALGRFERREAAGRAELIRLVNTGAEHEALRAAEALSTQGPEPAVEARVRTWLRDGSLGLRERWLGLAARLNLGASAEVVQRLTSSDENVRLSAAVAVAAAAAGPPRQTRQ